MPFQVSSKRMVWQFKNDANEKPQDHETCMKSLPIQDKTIVGLNLKDPDRYTGAG